MTAQEYLARPIRSASRNLLQLPEIVPLLYRHSRTGQDIDMKLAGIATACALMFISPLAFAQNAGTGSATTSGDSAVSPAAANPANGNASGANRPGPGAGIASGAMNNGTTGDTIGTGSGTLPAPAPGATATGPSTGGRKP
jgi:hypothetical protein